MQGAGLLIDTPIRPPFLLVGWCQTQCLLYLKMTGSGREFLFWAFRAIPSGWPSRVAAAGSVKPRLATPVRRAAGACQGVTEEGAVRDGTAFSVTPCALGGAGECPWAAADAVGFDHLEVQVRTPMPS